MNAEVFGLLKTSVEISKLGVDLANMILYERINKDEAREMLKKLEHSQRRMQRLSQKPIDIICQ